MRILIVGAGAVGSYLGARLFSIHHDVTFLIHESTFHSLTSSPLQVVSPLGDVTIPHLTTQTASTLDSTYDVVIYACKSFSLESALQDTRPAIAPSTILIPILNGFTHMDMIRQIYPHNPLFGASCFFSVSRTSTNTITHWSPNSNLLYGAYQNATPISRSLVQSLLNFPTLETSEVTDITQTLWDKWVFLATFAGATTLFRAPLGTIVSTHGDIFLRNLYSECLSIAASNMRSIAPKICEMHLANLLNPDSLLTASMFKDMENCKRTEADHILGQLIKLSKDPSTLCYLSLCYLNLQIYDLTRLQFSASSDINL